MESGFHKGIGVLLQSAVDGYAFERKVLLGEDCAGGNKAGEERMMCFFMIGVVLNFCY